MDISKGASIVTRLEVLTSHTSCTHFTKLERSESEIQEDDRETVTRVRSADTFGVV